MKMQALAQTGTGTDRTIDRPKFVAAVDLYETLDAYVVEAVLPGVAEEDLSLQLENGILLLEGEVRYELPEGYSQVCRGMVGGTYKRSFRLPDNIDAEAVGARLTNGVLVVRLPKRKNTKLRKIKVNVTG